MKWFIVLLIISGWRDMAYGQSSSVWHKYTDPKSELIGYKDAGGKIKIDPKFGGLTQALIFRNIIAVTEGSTLRSYYLLKNGKQVGRDSMYVWDMRYDIEQEGKIRFRDRKTDRVGFFNSNGQIAVPSAFNDAQPFYNNMAVVIHDEKRVCADGGTYDSKNPCEHWGWEGVMALIDIHGTIIADSLDVEQLQHLDRYSVKIGTKPADTVLWRSFKAKDGRYLSFIDHEKEFIKWLHERSAVQPVAIFDIVSVEGLFKDKLRIMLSTDEFNAKYRTALQAKLQRVITGKTSYFIVSDDLNSMIYTQPRFKRYYTDGGEANSISYPLFEVVTTTHNKQKRSDYQEHFSFLRTGKGYQLIGVAWKDIR